MNGIEMMNIMTNNDFKTFKIMFLQYADTHLTLEDKEMLLWTACQINRPRYVSWLLEQKVNVNAADKFDRETILMRAAAVNPKIVHILLDAGADVHATDTLGRVAAVYSLYVCEEYCFQLLMKAGTNINSLFTPYEPEMYHLTHPFIVTYMDQHMHQLTPENRTKWKQFRLKHVFK